MFELYRYALYYKPANALVGWCLETDGDRVLYALALPGSEKYTESAIWLTTTQEPCLQVLEELRQGRRRYSGRSGWVLDLPAGTYELPEFSYSEFSKDVRAEQFEIMSVMLFVVPKLEPELDQDRQAMTRQHLRV